MANSPNIGLTYFIAIDDFDVETHPHKKILTGTLLKSSQTNTKKRLLRLESCDVKTLSFDLLRDGLKIREIEPYYVDYLVGIDSLKKRIDALSDASKIYRASKAKVGEKVKVPVKTDSMEDLAVAYIRFKGKVKEKEGILFGIELFSHRGLGSTNGWFLGKQLFECEENCGMVVQFHKLEFHGKSEGTKAGGDNFKIGKPVNVVLDNELDGKDFNVTGMLKCIIPSKSDPNSLLAGIQLDENVKGVNYSGSFKGYSYFKADSKVLMFPLACVVPCDLITENKSNKGFFDHFKAIVPLFDTKKPEHGSSSYSHKKGKKKTEARDVIVPKHEFFTRIDDSLLMKISKGLGKNWLLMGERLPISQKDLGKISQDSSYRYYEEKALIMLKLWQEETVDMIDKLGFIAQICKNIEMDQLCNKILQGVDNEILELVAEEAYVKNYKLAKMLNIPDDVIDILYKKHRMNYKAICLEVLIIWRTNQPDSSDKISFLASVLDKLDLGHVATFLIQGLDDGLLQELSVGLAHSWEGVAKELGMADMDIHEIKCESRDKSKQAYQAFMNWKKQQPSEADKFGEMAEALKQSGHKDLANHLLGGIEDGAIHRIAIDLGKHKIDKVGLCGVLNFTNAQLNYFDKKFTTNFAVMKAMLRAWRAQLDRTQDKKEIVINLLTTWGFHNIARSVFPDVMGEYKINKIPDTPDQVEMDIDDGDNNDLDEIITIISGQLESFDVDALKRFFEVPRSSSTLEDVKSEGLKLLMQAREQYRDQFKNELIIALKSIARQDLADLLTAQQTTQVFKASKSQPTWDNKEMAGRQPFVLQHQFSIGTMVEVDIGKTVFYGVIKWIGCVPEMTDLLAGIELEEECDAATDGRFGTTRYFKTFPRHGFFTRYSKCRPDGRFSSPVEQFVSNRKQDVEFDSPSVTEITLPPMASKLHPYEALGIQGDQNSCYLDSTIFSMFAFVDVFDGLLHRPSNKDDINGYNEVQKVLKEDIVYPLRRNGFVKFENIRKLRKLLDQLGTTVGMRDQEKDPEEFLTLLLQEVLKSDPLFKIRVHGSQTAQEMNFYQMFMERDNTLKGTPNVQTLLEQSFLNTDIKFTEIPSCFVVQMPRFGKAYKLYNRILPTLELDITHMLENFPRPCVVCGRLSTLECRDCSSAKLGGEQITAYCQPCYERSHKKADKKPHGPRKLELPEYFPRNLTEDEERKELHSEIMELFAVVCIETSHYVAFVKSGEEKNSKWLFFDSMADRIGDQDGFNIPKIKELPEFLSWIENPKEYEHQSDRELEEPLRRLLCDAYMCFYRSTTVCA